MANRQYRSGKFTKAGDAISLFNPDEAGGCDGKDNDCFYDCIKAAYPDKVTKHFSKPWIFKRFFKLERDAKVPLKLCSEIEDKLKMRINVKGDYCKTSTKQYVRVVNLKLTKEHYTLDKDGAFEPKGIILKRYNDDRILPVVAYKWDDDNEQVQLYDGTTHSTMSKASLIEELKKQKFERTASVDTSRWRLPRRGRDQTLTKPPSTYSANTTSMSFQISSSKIRRLWHVHRHHEEQQLLKKGEFHQLTDEELSAKPGIPFGIYRAIIKGRVNGNMLFGKFIDQVLDWKKADVPRAKELYQRLWGALSKYNKSKEYVNIKAEKNVVVDKELGITDIYFKASLPENHSIDAMNITHNGNVMVKSINNLDTFDTPFARIMPFIISRGRKMIGTIIKDDIDCIKRVHTDGFVSTKPWKEKRGKKSLDYPKIGEECGDLKYEGYCPNAIVNNMLKPVGEFKI
ncbi:hypothetical protein SAMD00019534_115290 [Acytostelium subglobosum LB1]|uniref:hypothetical protein n=1 Tax=Acytostelium subglobosum LB1 TaxID=1410327 RepID=UPI0006448CC9|nr:hypothetical protein SAMD00019534_115290 [Acytostelium subglobosum LB1]GAM28353.1 hypothetical protein SAMD00019534_115290 [Acytostelium subglobosum LB1]|eukprot:XP_012748670.1 hypothetical protein SAMD00019534_115290 [Acytostelium subglobosum LB1]